MEGCNEQLGHFGNSLRPLAVAVKFQSAPNYLENNLRPLAVAVNATLVLPATSMVTSFV